MNLMLMATVLAILMIVLRLLLAEYLLNQSLTVQADAAFCVGIVGAAIAAGGWVLEGAPVAGGLILLLALPAGWFVGTFAVKRLEIEPPLLREWAEGNSGKRGTEQLR